MQVIEKPIKEKAVVRTNAPVAMKYGSTMFDYLIKNFHWHEIWGAAELKPQFNFCSSARVCQITKSGVFPRRYLRNLLRVFDVSYSYFVKSHPHQVIDSDFKLNFLLSYKGRTLEELLNYASLSNIELALWRERNIKVNWFRQRDIRATVKGYRESDRHAYEVERHLEIGQTIANYFLIENEHLTRFLGKDIVDFKKWYLQYIVK